jgi:alpha/beta superfamily hydrolase
MAAPAAAHPGRTFIDGPAGKLEAILARPKHEHPRGIAVVAHPHPLYGGTMHNKVVHTLARALLAQGYVVARFNFRGVEGSAGRCNADDDEGEGEVEDVLAVSSAVDDRFASLFPAVPERVLAGFSFGGAIQARAAQRLPSERLILVAPSVARLQVPPLIHPAKESHAASAPGVLMVHGDRDDIVPLQSVLDWAAPQELPVVVVPGAGHFFHGKLHLLRRIVEENGRR